MSLEDGCNNPIYSTPTDGKQFDELVEKLFQINDAFRKGPVPTAKDINEILDVLEQHLLRWVGDNSPCFIKEDYSFELTNYPIANYSGLYAALVKLIEQVRNQGIPPAFLLDDSCIRQETLTNVTSLLRDPLVVKTYI